VFTHRHPAHLLETDISNGRGPDTSNERLHSWPYRSPTNSHNDTESPLGGSSDRYASAFHVEVSTTSIHGKPYRVRLGDIYVPEELHDIVEAVIGFDNRPFARPHVRVSPRATTSNRP
jgi:hypothetical protein